MIVNAAYLILLFLQRNSQIHSEKRLTNDILTNYFMGGFGR